mgnify:FL=1
MPVCNCDQHRATHRFPGPGKVVYALTLTDGCDNCGVGVYVQIHRFTQDEAARAGILALPELEFRDLRADYGGRQATTQIWHPRDEAREEELLSETFAKLTKGKSAKFADAVLEAFPVESQLRAIPEKHSKTAREKL